MPNKYDYNDLEPGDVVVIDRIHSYNGQPRYITGTVTDVTMRQITVTYPSGAKAKFNRRNGDKWGSSGGWGSHPNIARHWSGGGFWTPQEADAANAEIEAESKRAVLAKKIAGLAIYKNLRRLDFETLTTILTVLERSLNEEANDA